MPKNNIYLPFSIEIDINYYYLLKIYNLAAYNPKDKRYNIIQFDTYIELADRLNVSPGTIKRILSNEKYNSFFSLNNKTIILNNDFKVGTIKDKKTFVVLDRREIDFLLMNKDSGLIRYYLYIKYYCTYAIKKGVKQDFTANQYLSFINLSISNNNNKSKLSKYNDTLKKNKFITIENYRDNKGHLRNIYRLL